MMRIEPTGFSHRGRKETENLPTKFRKYKKTQQRRFNKIIKLLRNNGSQVTVLKSKLRIEREDRLAQNRPVYWTSAGCIITWLQYRGYFRYKEYYNKEKNRVVRRSYIISDKDDKQIRIYDDKHGKLEYHDVKYDVKGKREKGKRIYYNGSLENIVGDCPELLKKRRSHF